MAAEFLLGGFLCLLSLEDIRRQEISFWLLGAGAGTGVVILISQTFAGWPDLLLRLLPGATLLLFAVLSKKIGSGDGMVFLIVGLFCPLDRVISIMAGSFLLSSIVALVLVAVRKKSKTDTFPFVPCIFAVYMAGLVFRLAG